MCVSLFDGLVSALCFPLSLHSAIQRRHGPEAGHQERERHPGGVRAQGGVAGRLQRRLSILTANVFFYSIYILHGAQTYHMS